MGFHVSGDVYGITSVKKSVIEVPSPSQSPGFLIRLYWFLIFFFFKRTKQKHCSKVSYLITGVKPSNHLNIKFLICSSK